MGGKKHAQSSSLGVQKFSLYCPHMIDSNKKAAVAWGSFTSSQKKITRHAFCPEMNGGEHDSQKRTSPDSRAEQVPLGLV